MARGGVRLGLALRAALLSFAALAGLSVTAYPGCAHTTAACQAFANLLNYGGQYAIPTHNPMDGTLANPVY